MFATASAGEDEAFCGGWTSFERDRRVAFELKFYRKIRGYNSKSLSGG